MFESDGFGACVQLRLLPLASPLLLKQTDFLHGRSLINLINNLDGLVVVVGLGPAKTPLPVHSITEGLVGKERQLLPSFFFKA